MVSLLVFLVLTRTLVKYICFFNDLFIGWKGKEMNDRSIHFPRWFYRLYVDILSPLRFILAPIISN
jgi:hypothetical protein